MSTTLDKGMQSLRIDDMALKSAPVPQATKKVMRPRPKFHKRLHPSHADIPFIPEERDTCTHHYWHFGWPISDDLVNNVLDTYLPNYLNDDHPPTVKYACFSGLVKKLTQCPALRFVLVKPNASAPWQSPLADDGEKAVTFLMVVSDCSTAFFKKRPTKDQVGRLVRVFGSEPCWMMDARPKSRWHEYGHTA
ncbi:hypothetical protein BD626DRAFT_542322 [Schizophyllum amplum]|uniref:Uncharacterized protein n=1 Tax=Schizophyllum amplum TaxID=97359 RepID=A0A550BSN8_9AGAR|nr:hypothetical protein BD626DRAFT_542322 [Auriculariopsis ampla]